METKILPTSDISAIDQALSVLAGGGLVAFPTDTVYGLAGLVFNSASIDRIFLAKGRDSAKAIPILIGDMEQLGLVTSVVTPSASILAAHFWPGALTLVVPSHPSLPPNLSQTPTVGVRMPDHSFTLALLRRSGPLAVTSANLSGGESQNRSRRFRSIERQDRADFRWWRSTGRRSLNRGGLHCQPGPDFTPGRYPGSGNHTAGDKWINSHRILNQSSSNP